MIKMTAIEKNLLLDYLKEYENYCFQKTEKKQYLHLNFQRAQKLYELNPEQPVYHLMCAAMMIYAGKKAEGEAILKKYEHNPVIQFRNMDFRAYFLYLAALLTEDKQQRANIVAQLQKIYQKNPAQPTLYWFLVKLDEGFAKNPGKKLAFLEKQWRLGCNQNLLYIETIKTLTAHMEIVCNLDDFLMQTYIWAQRRQLLTKEMGGRIAQSAMRLKSCDAKYEYLLREAFRIFSTKELLAALCGLYIRAGRTDKIAVEYYAKGIEYDLKLTNLYEYYMMSSAEHEKKALPEPVLLHFLYHDTLFSTQKAYLYKNLVCYRESKPEIYEKYREKIEKYTVDSLLQRKISPEYAYLYENVLCPQGFTKEMAEAMTDLMFLRRLTCQDPRIREAEVSYEQLSFQKRACFKKHQVYLPVYTPSAVITLIDEKGNQYRNTIPYQLEKLLDEKRYIEVCREQVQNHPGLLLYLCGKNPGKGIMNEEIFKLCMQIPQTRGFTDDYLNQALLAIFEKASLDQTLEQLPESWFLTDYSKMSREQRGKMTEFLVRRGMEQEAFEKICRYGNAFISAHTLMHLLVKLSESREAETETYYRLCYGCFKNGQMNFITLKYLSENFLGTCGQMAGVWCQAKAFGVNTFHLEERILTQMMFTGTELAEGFDIYLSYNEHGPEEVLKKAYLTYMSWEAFVKNKSLDNRFYFLLEDELLRSHGYAQICMLAYLKYLSGLQILSGKQKRTAAFYLKEFFSRKCYFSFMKNFGNTVKEALVLEDKLFVEYYASPLSKVVLHYVIERDQAEEYSYTEVRLYPLCGGVYSKAFSLFAGEKITYFFTEEKEDGTKISTALTTKEMKSVLLEPRTKYARLNELRSLKTEGKKEEFAEKAQEYRFLEAAQELFSIK